MGRAVFYYHTRNKLQNVQSHRMVMISPLKPTVHLQNGNSRSKKERMVETSFTPTEHHSVVILCHSLETTVSLGRVNYFFFFLAKISGSMTVQTWPKKI